MNRHTVNYTHDEMIAYHRNIFLRAYLDKHLSDRPEIKNMLENKFQKYIEEIGL